MVYPILLPLMRTPRLPVVDWTDAPRTDLNGLVRFAERLNLISARVPSRFKRSLTAVQFPDVETCGVTQWGNTLEKGCAGYEASTCWMARDDSEECQSQFIGRWHVRSWHSHNDRCLGTGCSLCTLYPRQAGYPPPSSPHSLNTLQASSYQNWTAPPSSGFVLERRRCSRNSPFRETRVYCDIWKRMSLFSLQSQMNPLHTLFLLNLFK